MATTPRTLAPDEPLDDVEAFLDHLHLHLLACPFTAQHAPPFAQLLTELTSIRVSRAALARAVFALKAKEIFTDDELNVVLDQVKDALGADKSEAAKALYADVFEGKSPSEVRKHVLGPQLTTMTVWPGKLAGAANPAVQQLGVASKGVTEKAHTLLNDIGAAETALAHFDAGPRAAFIASCNAAVKAVFGKLSEMEHSPPDGALPPGFVDRFFLRDTSARAPSITEMEASIERTKAKLARQEAWLRDAKEKQAKDRKAKLSAALREKAAKAEAAQKAAAEAAAELQKLQAEMAKEGG